MNNWETAWKSALGLPEFVPQWLVAGAAILFMLILVILPCGAFVGYLERKLGADLQARVGPKRAGRHGLLQPFADLLKLLQKEPLYRFSIGPNYRDLWLAVQTMALYCSIAVLPIGSAFLLLDTDMSVFIPFWAALVTAWVTLLLGLSQDSVPGWFGGIRQASQAVAGALPALITILSAGVQAGGFRWSTIVQGQGASPLHWNIVTNPFQIVALVVFEVSGLILLAIFPLDGKTSQNDIQGGVASQSFGLRVTLFRLSRFYGFFLWSLIAVVLFLGGWNLPPALVTALKDSDSWRSLEALELFILMLKTLSVMILVILIGTVTPKLRSDQITDLSWKVLSPLSLLTLAGTVIVMGCRALL